MKNLKSSQKELPKELTLSTEQRIELIANVIIDILNDEFNAKEEIRATSTSK